MLTTTLRTPSEQRMWVRKRMPQVQESQSFQFMFRVVFLMDELNPTTSEFMTAFLMACNAEPQDERCRVLVPCQNGDLASLALQQLSPLRAIQDLQTRAVHDEATRHEQDSSEKQSPDRDSPERSEGHLQIRPICMRARSFSAVEDGLPEVPDVASSESTMLVYVLQTNLPNDAVECQFNTMSLLENMYNTAQIGAFSPRRMLLVFQDPEVESAFDVVTNLQEQGLTALETVSLNWSAHDGNSLWELAGHIAQSLSEKNADVSPSAAQEDPFASESNRFRLDPALGASNVAI
jgi:hypothetical protein